MSKQERMMLKQMKQLEFQRNLEKQKNSSPENLGAPIATSTPAFNPLLTSSPHPEGQQARSNPSTPLADMQVDGLVAEDNFEETSFWSQSLELDADQIANPPVQQTTSVASRRHPESTIPTSNKVAYQQQTSSTGSGPLRRPDPSKPFAIPRTVSDSSIAAKRRRTDAS
ncbi:uncharacterized protein LOC127852224 [Dreissena polymorpha]|uniref:Uncharacterized protein n=1 Tax=Dreissena polymorpha TaxID=45954 RepID=A0A9D4CJ34_DREPO|nr:uncharacterized protein LOC127852224 [Dreissena polymorpha]KAH3725240.1 hypothetical protein DPMN_051075 [Dreissena polymorpha]